MSDRDDRRFILSLLACGSNVENAARIVGVDTDTARAWAADPALAQRYHPAQRRAVLKGLLLAAGVALFRGRGRLRAREAEREA